MKSKITIEVNGKRYDATTGAVIGAASAPPVNHGRNIDGFFRSRPASIKKVPPVADDITILAAPAPSAAPRHHKQPERAINHARAHTPQTAVTVPVQQRIAVAPNQKVTVRHTVAAINHTKHRKAQSSVTLRRDGVQRPAPSFYKQAGTQGALQHTVPSLIAPKPSVASVNPDRLVRAQGIARSPQIAHHSTGSQRGIQPTVVPLAVQPVPTVKPGGEEPTAPSPTPTNQPPGDIFEQALMNASHFVDVHTHVRHHKKQVRRHLVSMAAGTLALVIIAAFAVYQNAPSLQFRVASIQAGVSTGMPNFKAAGFNYTTARAKSGKLTVGFTSAHSTYQLTQQSTNLSDTDVIQNIGATDAGGNPNYTTVNVGGTTVYRFTNTDATWVTNGTWYTVNGNGPLTDQQVTSLVHNV